MDHMKIVYKQMGEIKPYANNPRRNKRAIGAVAESIRRYGFLDPIVLDENDVIICGHTRYSAAQKLFMNEVPCVYADGLTDEEVAAYRLADNKVSELAEWDEDKLETELASIPDDMLVFGFTRPMQDGVVQDDFGGKIQAGLKVESGEVWTLGRHRLVIDGSLDAILNGQKADAMFSFIERGYPADLLASELNEVSMFCLKPGASYYLWHDDAASGDVRGACRAAGLTVRQCLVWNRQGEACVPQDGYISEHMPCLYGWIDGSTHLWASNRKQTTVLRYDVPPDDGLSVPLVAYCMLNNTRGMDIVVDPWSRRGELLMAAEQAGRIGYARCRVEDAAFIISRYISFFGAEDVRCLSREKA